MRSKRFVGKRWRSVGRPPWHCSHWHQCDHRQTGSGQHSNPVTTRRPDHSRAKGFCWHRSPTKTPASHWGSKRCGRCRFGHWRQPWPVRRWPHRVGVPVPLPDWTRGWWVPGARLLLNQARRPAQSWARLDPSGWRWRFEIGCVGFASFAAGFPAPRSGLFVVPVPGPRSGLAGAGPPTGRCIFSGPAGCDSKARCLHPACAMRNNCWPVGRSARVGCFQNRRRF